MYAPLTLPIICPNRINMEKDSNGYSSRRIQSLGRRSTSSHNFQAPTIPPSMPPTLPSIAYYSLNRNRNRNNLNITNYNKYQTLAHVNTGMSNKSNMSFPMKNTTIKMNTNDISYSDYGLV
jgi:hypothetical protein